MTFDENYMREHLNELRREDAAALRSFNACHNLTDVERERAMAWTAKHRPDRIRPLYRFTPTDTGVRIIDYRRDQDDEPWGDPVGLGMPRQRVTLLMALWNIATAKYRRVW